MDTLHKGDNDDDNNNNDDDNDDDDNNNNNNYYYYYFLLTADVTAERPIRKLALTHIDRTVKKKQVI